MNNWNETFLRCTSFYDLWLRDLLVSLYVKIPLIIKRFWIVNTYNNQTTVYLRIITGLFVPFKIYAICDSLEYKKTTVFYKWLKIIYKRNFTVTLKDQQQLYLCVIEVTVESSTFCFDVLLFCLLPSFTSPIINNLALITFFVLGFCCLH